MTITWSPIRMASLRSWVTNTVVRRSSACSWSSRSCMSRRISGSSAENGSSMSRIGGSTASARARPTRWRMPPESSWGTCRPGRPGRRGRARRRRARGAPPCRPPDLQAVRRVVAHGAVREEREVLEDHADVVVADLAQPGVADLGDVLAVDEQLPGGGLVEAVDHPQDGRLARAREAHDDEHLAAADREAHVAGPEEAARPRRPPPPGRRPPGPCAAWRSPSP